MTIMVLSRALLGFLGADLETRIRVWCGVFGRSSQEILG